MRVSNVVSNQRSLNSFLPLLSTVTFSRYTSSSARRGKADLQFKMHTSTVGNHRPEENVTN